ncbi:hypothetical protein H0H87_011608 [Tephrocybe sp. NHM501043]|nr:hypothetical protein H0H87_011608 [Tephrocybe sp. NHM501043]
MDQLANRSFGPGFKDANWALLLFAVDPVHHHKGIGNALMKVTEEKAKHNNLSIVLETTTELNLLIYKRMGFEIKGEFTVVSPVGQSPVYQLIKTPRA